MAISTAINLLILLNLISMDMVEQIALKYIFEFQYFMFYLYKTKLSNITNWKWVSHISMQSHALMLTSAFLTHRHSLGIRAGHKFLNCSFTYTELWPMLYLLWNFLESNPLNSPGINFAFATHSSSITSQRKKLSTLSLKISKLESSEKVGVFGFCKIYCMLCSPKDIDSIPYKTRTQNICWVFSFLLSKF